MGSRVHLYDQIKETFLLLDFGDRRLFETYGLTVSRYYALFHIAADPGLSPSRLSDRMFCDKSNITRLLHSLEAEGYVERRPHERDRRLHSLYLSPSGSQLQRQVQTAHEAYIAQRLGGLDPGEVERLSATLRLLNRQLDLELGREGPLLVN